MTALTQNQIQSFNERLSARRSQLLDDILLKIRGVDEDCAFRLEEQLKENDDYGVAQEIINLELEYLETETRQLRGVQAAKQRIKDGTYGECIDCRQHISPDRLELQPSAARCVQCQELFERVYGSEERESPH